MRIPILPFFILLLISVISDIYIYRCVACRLKNRIWRKIQAWSALLFYVMLFVALCLPRRDGDNETLLTIMWMLFTFISVYSSKYLFVIFDLLANIPRLFKKRRVKFLSCIGGVLSIIAFVSLWWGALVNRFNIDKKTVAIVRNEIPEAFDGYRIVQISDLHTGTYGNSNEFLENLVDSINALSPDLITFTGDIVNSRSSELTAHAATLSRLKAKDGVVSILGNHDYGDYSDWDSEEEKALSVQYLKKLQARMGWKMLNNESVTVVRGNDSIVIIGVENIGDAPFPIYGSLKKAYDDISDPSCKILLSHNPAHWADSISDNPSANIMLTLSGHTHAMQMELAGKSPAVFRYPQWGGLYSDTDSTHLLYVNIGAGTVGFPARIGATPEITLITLRHK